MSSPPQPNPNHNTLPKPFKLQKRKNNFIFPSRPGGQDYFGLVANDAVSAQKVERVGLRNKHQRPILVRDDPMRSSRSTLKVYKYSEAEGEEDYSDVFGRDTVSDSYDPDASADNELRLQTRLSSSSWVRPVPTTPNCQVYFLAD